MLPASDFLILILHTKVVPYILVAASEFISCCQKPWALSVQRQLGWWRFLDSAGVLHYTSTVNAGQVVKFRNSDANPICPVLVVKYRMMLVADPQLPTQSNLVRGQKLA